MQTRLPCLWSSVRMVDRVMHIEDEEVWSLAL